MLPIDHSYASQGFSGSLWVGVEETRPSDGDESGLYVGVECAPTH
jgi:hypothetical protein